MYAIHQEISDFVGTSTSFIDYITHFNSYDSAAPENKSNHVAYCDEHKTKKKYKVRTRIELQKRNL